MDNSKCTYEKQAWTVVTKHSRTRINALRKVLLENILTSAFQNQMWALARNKHSNRKRTVQTALCFASSPHPAIQSPSMFMHQGTGLAKEAQVNKPYHHWHMSRTYSFQSASLRVLPSKHLLTSQVLENWKNTFFPDHLNDSLQRWRELKPAWYELHCWISRPRES